MSFTLDASLPLLDSTLATLDGWSAKLDPLILSVTVIVQSQIVQQITVNTVAIQDVVVSKFIDRTIIWPLT